MLNLRWPTPNGRPPQALWITVLAVLLLLLASAPLVEFNLWTLITKADDTVRFMGRMFHQPPEWEYLPQFALKMLETLEIALLATVLATLISLPLGFLAARNATRIRGWGKPCGMSRLFCGHCRNWCGRWCLCRRLVWGRFRGYSPLPSSVGFMARFFADAIEVIPSGPVEGVAAHGRAGCRCAVCDVPASLAGLYRYVAVCARPQCTPPRCWGLWGRWHWL